MNERIISADGRMFVEISYDYYPPNPREEYDPITEIVYWSNRRRMGDREVAPEDFVQPEAAWAFPVELAPCWGDATQLRVLDADVDPGDPYGLDEGVIIIPKGEDAPTREKALALCRSEVELFNAYLSGDTYILTEYRVPENLDAATAKLDDCREVDCVGGYFGRDETLAIVRERIDEYNLSHPAQGRLFDVA